MSVSDVLQFNILERKTFLNHSLNEYLNRDKITSNVFGFYESYLYGMIESKSGLNRILKWFMRLLLILGNLYILSKPLYSIINELRYGNGYGNTDHVLIISHNVIFIVYIIMSATNSMIRWRRFEKTNRLMVRIIRHYHSNDEQIGKLRRINMIMSLIFFTAITSIISMSIYFQIKTNDDFHYAEFHVSIMKVVIITITALSIHFYMSGSICRSIMAYTYISYAFNSALTRYLSGIMKTSDHGHSSSFTINKIRDMKLMVKTHREIREEINSLMGVYPLISVSMIFMFSCTFFVVSVVRGQGLGFGWVEYFFMLSFNITMVIILSSCPNDNDCYLKIISLISQDNNDDNPILNHNKLILINYLHSLVLNPIQHNACHLFSINKMFALNLVGSLIPFCVMFIQLFQATK
jgi:hypothetical protein